MTKIVYIGPGITLLLLFLVVFLALTASISLTALLINSIVGIVLLFLVNLFPQIEIPITIWSVLIVALGGVLGLVLLILLNLAKVI